MFHEIGGIMTCKNGQDSNGPPYGRFGTEFQPQVDDTYSCKYGNDY